MIQEELVTQLTQQDETILGTPVWELPPTFELMDRNKPNATIYSGPFEIMFFNGFAVKTYANDMPDKHHSARIMVAKEGAVLHNLRHKNITEIPGFLLLPDARYGVMLPIMETDLNRRLKRDNFTVQEAINLISPICDAVAYAHSRGVIHLGSCED